MNYVTAKGEELLLYGGGETHDDIKVKSATGGIFSRIICGKGCDAASFEVKC